MKFNPANEIVKKQYEEALLHGRRRDPKTVRAVWKDLVQFEKFTGCADFRTFNAEQAKDFKFWLEAQKNRRGELLALPTISSTLTNIREFFYWLAIHPKYIRKVDPLAIEYLHLSHNASRAARASRPSIPPTLEELQTALEAMPHGNDIELRDRAVFAFTIITCVRDDALVSLKRKDVNAIQKTVWQDPKHVRTKGRKGILTRFVGQAIPLAEQIVLEWLEHCDGTLKLAPTDALFPKTRVRLNHATLLYEVDGLTREHWANAAPVRDIFRAAFKNVGLPYYNPHLLRNTISKWALKNATQYEFKALSQNFGHEHTMTTYNSYAKLSPDEQLEAIARIGERSANLSDFSHQELLNELLRRSTT